MTSEERQARALEGIERHMYDLVKMFGDLGENLKPATEAISSFAELGSVVKEMFEKQDTDTALQQFAMECGCSVLHCDYHLAGLDRQKKAAQAESQVPANQVLDCGCVVPPNTTHNCPKSKYTPLEWMDKLKRWWNYEADEEIDKNKLTRSEFFAYMARVPSHEVTHQVPDKYKIAEHRPITFRISQEDNALTESELEQRRISMLGMSAPNWQTGALIKVIDPRSPHFGSTGVVTELHRTCLDLDFGSSVGEYDYYQVALVSNTTVNERKGEGSE